MSSWRASGLIVLTAIARAPRAFTWLHVLMAAHHGQPGLNPFALATSLR